MRIDKISLIEIEIVCGRQQREVLLARHYRIHVFVVVLVHARHYISFVIKNETLHISKGIMAKEWCARTRAVLAYPNVGGIGARAKRLAGPLKLRVYLHKQYARN